MKKFTLIFCIFLIGCQQPREQQVDNSNLNIFMNGGANVRVIEWEGHEFFSSSGWGNFRTLCHKPNCKSPEHICKCKNCGWE